MSSPQKLSIRLTNASLESFAILEELRINWPALNRKLRSIALNGSTVFDRVTAWSPGGLTIDSWRGSRSLRLLAPGEKATLSFEFEAAASTDLNTYHIELGFGAPYLKEAGSKHGPRISNVV